MSNDMNNSTASTATEFLKPLEAQAHQVYMNVLGASWEWTPGGDKWSEEQFERLMGEAHDHAEDAYIALSRAHSLAIGLEKSEDGQVEIRTVEAQLARETVAHQLAARGLD